MGGGGDPVRSTDYNHARSLHIGRTKVLNTVWRLEFIILLFTNSFATVRRSSIFMHM